MISSYETCRNLRAILYLCQFAYPLDGRMLAHARVQAIFSLLLSGWLLDPAQRDILGKDLFSNGFRWCEGISRPAPGTYLLLWWCVRLS